MVTPVAGLLAGIPLPGRQGWATVVFPTVAPALLTLVLPTTVLVPPAVAPLPGMLVARVPIDVPVAGLPVEMLPVPVVGDPGTMLVLHGPATVLTGGPTVVRPVEPGAVPAGLEVTEGVPLTAPGAVEFWLGVVVVVWLGVVVVLWLGVMVVD